MAERPLEELSYSELRAEIQREESILKENRSSLEDAESRLQDLEESIEGELAREEVERWVSRRRIIERLRERIETRAKRIDALTRRALELERLPVVISVVSRYIRLEVAASLWRSVWALRGWQTRDRRALRSYLGWQTREAPRVVRLRLLLEERGRWTAEQERLAKAIGEEERLIEYKYGLLPKKELARVGLNFYLIIERGEHEYPRPTSKAPSVVDRHYVYRTKTGGVRRGRQRVKYPKGAFQAWWQVDAFRSLETGQIIREEEPFPTLEPLMRRDTAREFMEEFNVPEVDPDSLTLGIVSEIPPEEEVGKPPYKDRVERTVEDTFGSPYRVRVEEYLMTDAEYDSLTSGMTQYRDHLERE